MIECFKLKNSSGVSLDVINLGAAITALRVPDKFGEVENIVLGYANLGDYRTNPDCFGAVVGRVANRIAKGSFHLHNVAYPLARNQGDDHLHGGAVGFHRRLWSADHTADTPLTNSLKLNYLSEDGEEGYPGNLSVSVNYCLTQENELVIDYSATTDKPTIMNLTQHSYFNLGGHASGDILGHLIKVYASRFTATGPDQIPTGELMDVANTALDLQKFARIGDVLEGGHLQLKYADGLDHNYILKDSFDNEMRIAAEVLEPRTGRFMRVVTDQPGVQLYTGNNIGSGVAGKDGAIYNRRQGLCLETQHFPDAPNHCHFPSIVLQPGQTFRSRTIYQFSTEGKP